MDRINALATIERLEQLGVELANKFESTSAHQIEMALAAIPLVNQEVYEDVQTALTNVYHARERADNKCLPNRKRP